MTDSDSRKLCEEQLASHNHAGDPIKCKCDACILASRILASDGGAKVRVYAFTRARNVHYATRGGRVFRMEALSNPDQGWVVDLIEPHYVNVCGIELSPEQVTDMLSRFPLPKDEAQAPWIG